MSSLHGGSLSSGFGVFGPFTRFGNDANANTQQSIEYLKEHTGFNTRHTNTQILSQAVTSNNGAAAILTGRITAEDEAYDEIARTYQRAYNNVVATVGDFQAKQIASIAADGDMASKMALVNVKVPLAICDAAASKISNGQFKTFNEMRSQQGKKSKK